MNNVKEHDINPIKEHDVKPVKEHDIKSMNEHDVNPVKEHDKSTNKEDTPVKMQQTSSEFCLILEAPNKNCSRRHFILFLLFSF